jgi:rhodanese-related sulfurtransferase
MEFANCTQNPASSLLGVKILGLTCLLSLMSGCVRIEAQQAAYRKISAAEAHKMMAELKDYILLDVRTEAEYKEKRIEGAVLIPDYEIKNRAEKELPVKNRVILVYCRSGGRSANAARTLASLGYVNVYDFGGINNWPYKTIGG